MTVNISYDKPNLLAAPIVYSVTTNGKKYGYFTVEAAALIVNDETLTITVIQSGQTIIKTQVINIIGSGGGVPTATPTPLPTSTPTPLPTSTPTPVATATPTPSAASDLFFIDTNAGTCAPLMTASLKELDQNTFTYVRVCTATSAQPLSVGGTVTASPNDDARLASDVRAGWTLSAQNWNLCTTGVYCHPDQKQLKTTGVGNSTDDSPDTVVYTASATGYNDGTLNVNIEDDTGGTTPAGGALRFAEANSSPLVEITNIELSECNGGNGSPPGSQNVWLCPPDGVTSGSISVTLSEGSDPDNLLNTPTTATINAPACASVNIPMNSNTVANAYNSVTITATATGYDPATLTVYMLDNEMESSDWTWTLYDSPEWGDTGAIISGKVELLPPKSAYMCEATFRFEDETSTPYTNSASPVYIPNTTSSDYCTQASWNFEYTDGSETKIVYYSDMLAGAFPLPIQVRAGNFPLTEEDCIPPLCLWSPNDGGTSSDVLTWHCEPMTEPGLNISYPTFLLTASYDWLHNFYDNNADAGGSTDPDTDNFNKIILMDSNLFPIHTALSGDQEFPDIVMRNWSSGTGKYSPSLNDYMNRSVAAVANYLPYTITVPYGYGSLRGLKAVGMRSSLEWVYTTDPANNNLRRYRFIKIDDFQVEDTIDYQDVQGDVIEPADDEWGAYENVKQCDVCDDHYWYIGDVNRVLCDGDGAGKAGDCCNCDWDEDDKFLFISKMPGGGTTQYDIGGTGNNIESPNAQLTLKISQESYDAAVASGGDYTAKINLQGFKFSNDADLVLTLNAGHANSNCTKSTSTGDSGISTGANNWMLTGASGVCTDVTQPIKNYCKSNDDFTFGAVNIADCATDAGDYYTMTVDLEPQGHAGWVIVLKGQPDPRDNAFRVPIEGYDNITGGEFTNPSIDAGKLQEERWANIDGYLDLMPPESYLGYPSYTAVDPTQRSIGYGSKTNTRFDTISSIDVHFKNPRDVDAYRDYFDLQNQGPVYVFVADTMNSRIQVFMNATGVAGLPGAEFPFRPVPVKGPNDTAGGTTAYGSNELGLRLYNSSNNSTGFGDGRRGDYRGYTTVDGSTYAKSTVVVGSASPGRAGGPGEFFYPHGVAVDQDPNSKDVYLFVADTYNHRIQIFRDFSGVTNQAITNKRFDFRLERIVGSYPLQTTMTMTEPGPFNFRYPKGIDVVRFKNNSTYLYVVDSKNYRVMKYAVGDGASGITGMTAKSGFGYDGSQNKFVSSLLNKAGTPVTGSNTTPGFLNPQDVAAGYSGFFLDSEDNVHYLNNYMVYVSDYARNNSSITPSHLNMRVMQLIDVPPKIIEEDDGTITEQPVFSNLSGSYIPWETETVLFGARDNLALGQSPYGIYNGVYNSTGDTSKQTGSTSNVPGKSGYFTDRPVGLAALQWNTSKPIDIRVVKEDKTEPAYLSGAEIPGSVPLRIGVSSRILRFSTPFDNAFAGFWNTSSTHKVPDYFGRWDGVYSGPVHIFCYDSRGVYKDHTALPTPPYITTLSSLSNCSSGSLIKIVAEDKDFEWSARSGTGFYKVK